MRVAVIVPAYNEEKKIAGVLRALETTGYTIVVVDDSSADNTGEFAKNFPVFYIKHAVNLGQGAALRSGSEFAIGLGFDIIAHFDADGQHRIKDLETVVSAVKNNQCDVSLGSRFLESKSAMPFKKRMILWFAKVFTQKILQLQFTDPQNGLRAFKAECWDKLKWQSDDFAHCSEILHNIIKAKLDFVEVPIIINYDSYSSSKPIKPRLRMGWRMLFQKIIEL